MASLYEPEIDLVGQGHRVGYGTAPPAAASDAVGISFSVGDRIYNTAPLLSGVLGWICTTAGSPGTWVEMGGQQGVGVNVANAAVLAMHATPIPILPAQGAGTLIEVISMVLENIFLTGAYANGGAIGLYYGAAASVLASATLASTFLTSPAANQIGMVAGALASNLSSAVLNQPLVLSCAGAEFITGAGSLIARVKYRVHTGL